MPSVLIVDDEKVIRTMLSQALRIIGYRVYTASDGKEATRRVKNTPIDVVVTDIFMPVSDGFELIERIRELRPGAKIVAMSGGGLLDMRAFTMRLASELRLDGYLEKPFQLADFVDTVGEAIRGKAPSPGGSEAV